MPWHHCGHDLTDDEACPECDVTKETWTVRYDRTRAFNVKRRSWLKIALVDDRGRALADEPYQVISLAGSILAEGTLDAEGRAEVRKLRVDQVAVVFPRRDPAWFRQELALPGIEEALPEVELAESSGEAVQGKGWLAIHATDDREQPLAEEPVEVRHPESGEVLWAGKLDAEGRARASGLPPELSAAKVVFPRRDGGWFRQELALPGIEEALPEVELSESSGEAVQSKAWVALHVTDDRQQPFADEPVEVRHPESGEVLWEGKLDAEGRARASGLPAGLSRARIHFPRREAGWFKEAL